VGYYVTNYLEILDKEKMGSGMDIPALYRLWREGMASLSEGEQAEIKETIGKHKKPSLIWLRRFVRQRGLAPYYSIVIGKIRNLLQRSSGKPVFSTVFDAARQTDLLCPRN
jgi:hypothetical protein